VILYGSRSLGAFLEVVEYADAFTKRELTQVQERTLMMVKPDGRFLVFRYQRGVGF
jgi:hypothetical protein